MNFGIKLSAPQENIDSLPAKYIDKDQKQTLQN